MEIAGLQQDGFSLDVAFMGSYHMQAPMLPGGTHLAYWDSDSASLLNNKAMEVYNHWGAVDEHVALPESVVSQFFTTRATYYDPTQVLRGDCDEVSISKSCCQMPRMR